MVAAENNIGIAGKSAAAITAIMVHGACIIVAEIPGKVYISDPGTAYISNTMSIAKEPTAGRIRPAVVGIACCDGKTIQDGVFSNTRCFDYMEGIISINMGIRAYNTVHIRCKLELHPLQ